LVDSKTAYDVDKLMEVALKLIYNSAISQLCQCLRQAQMSKYFQCLVGKAVDCLVPQGTVFFKQIIVDLSGKCKPEEFRSQEGYLK